MTALFHQTLHTTIPCLKLLPLTAALPKPPNMQAGWLPKRDSPLDREAYKRDSGPERGYMQHNWTSFGIEARLCSPVHDHVWSLFLVIPCHVLHLCHVFSLWTFNLSLSLSLYICFLAKFWCFVFFIFLWWDFTPSACGEDFPFLSSLVIYCDTLCFRWLLCSQFQSVRSLRCLYTCPEYPWSFILHAAFWSLAGLYQLGIRNPPGDEACSRDSWTWRSRGSPSIARWDQVSGALWDKTATESVKQRISQF